MRRTFVTLCALGVVLAGCSEPANDPEPTALVEGLGDTCSTSSFGTLDQNKAPDVLQALLKGTSHTSPRVRAQCAKLLERKKDITALDVLRKMLDDPDFNARMQAGRSYVSLSDNEDVLRQLRAAGATTRAQYSLLVALLREDPATLGGSELPQWLLDPKLDGSLRVAAYETLRDVPAPEGGWPPELLAKVKSQALEPTGEQELRAAALVLYGHMGGPPALSDLLKQSRPAQLREAAVLGMGYTLSPEAPAALLSILLDRQLPLSVREQALQALGQFPRNPEARDDIIRALQDPDQRVRSKAASTLACFPGKEVREALHKVAETELNEEVNCKIESALRRQRKRK